MTLRLFNTLTKRKEEFVPADPTRVTMYVCGPTVYDRPHLGNARTAVISDLLARVLRHRYGAANVRVVRNITDVDDKINAAAAERGVPIRALTEQTLAQYQADMAALAVAEPDVAPRVTDSIPAIVAMIARLVATGAAYAVDGHVLMSVAAVSRLGAGWGEHAWRYGQLSGRSVAEMIAGARVEIAPYKRDSADFVLWKPSPPELPGWASPWGRGRPGWHIECSAMIAEHLGETIDLHAGGNDLLFPHHENEAAQSACAHGGRPLARFWLHYGMLTVDGAKMSKSAGNFLTVSDLIERGVAPEVIRFALLKTHYRQPMDWTGAGLTSAEAELLAINRRLAERDVRPDEAAAENHDAYQALYQNLNTPLAITVLHDLTKRAASPHVSADRARAELWNLSSFLGITRENPQDLVDAIECKLNTVSLSVLSGRLTSRVELSAADLDLLKTQRDAARKAKNYAEADRLKTELRAFGIVPEDRPDGTTEWRRAG